VREAVVVAREDTPGDKRLVAYLVARPGSAQPSPADLRAALRERLPEFMVPAAFVFLRSLPLTPNNKVDRKALPAPGAAKKQAQAVSAPQPAGPPTAFEEQILTVWRDVLGLQTVGAEDNFFDLGGHSLLAVKAHRLLKETLQRELAITDLFRFPTVRSLATFLGEGVDTTTLKRSGARGEARRAMLQRRAQPAQARAGSDPSPDAP
jgi:hypothetical protein